MIGQRILPRISTSGSRVVVRQLVFIRWSGKVGRSRHFSSTPLVYSGVSGVPGSGTGDGWSEKALQVDGSTADVLQPDMVQAVSEAVQHGHDLASLGLGVWYTPVGIVQILLDSLHHSTGLPWWGTIAITTCALRLLLFPLSVKFASNAAKMAKIQPQVTEVMKKVQYYSKIGATELLQKEQVKVAEIYREHNCSPFTMMALPFLQLPFFVSFFMGLRKMALAPLGSMKSGGMWWFSDLTLPDPTYVLPLMACGLFITNIQVSLLQTKTQVGIIITLVNLVSPTIVSDSGC